MQPGGVGADGCGLVIVAGHIDLSVGSVCGFIGAVAAVLMVQYEWHFVPATLACIAVGAVIGGAQGWFIAFFKVPSFIVTLRASRLALSNSRHTPSS